MEAREPWTILAGSREARHKGPEKPYTASELKDAVLAKLTYSVGKVPEVASPRDWFLAVAFATRDIIVERWLDSTAGAYADGRKRVYYLSLEFLIGRLLFDAMTNLGVAEPMAEALHDLGVNLTELRRVEPDAALGNGGLGGLPPASWRAWRRCRIAAHGYGIRYDHGLFRQTISGRLAARIARGLAGLRQSVGVRAPRDQLCDRLWRLGRNDPGEAERRVTSGSRRRSSRRSPTTPRSSAGAASM